MRLSVVACSGCEVASFDAEPTWQLPEVLAALPEEPKGTPPLQRRLFLGELELLGEATLASLGAGDGAVLTLLRSRLPLLATGEGDGCVRLWSSETGEGLRVLQEGQDVWGVRALAFSHNGCQLVASSFCYSAQVWDADTGKRLHVLKGHQGQVAGACFSPDGGLILTASYDGTARLWDMATGECLRVLAGRGRDHVTSCAFSPDGSKVLTASKDGSALLWEVSSGECLRSLTGHDGWVLCTTFSPDGSLVLTGGRDGTARLWCTEDGVCQRVLQTQWGWVRDVAFSPSAGTLLTASGKGQLWSASTGEELLVLEQHTKVLLAGCFSADGARVLTASEDGTAKLWCATSGQCLHTLRGEAPMWSVAFSPMA